MSALEKSIQKEREKIVDGVLMACGAIIVLPVAASFGRITDIGWQPVMALQLVTLVLCWVAVLLRKRIGYIPKAILITTLFMTTSIVGVYQFGIIGNGMTFSILAPVLAAMFFNMRVALTLFGLVTASIAMIGFYVVQTNYVPGFNLQTYVVNYKSWLDFLFAFIFVAGILTVTAGVLFNRLTRKLIEVDMLKNEAEKKVTILSGLLPICSYCKKIRDDKGYWNQLETYISHHSDAEFSHGICEECAHKLYPDLDLYDDQKVL